MPGLRMVPFTGDACQASIDETRALPGLSVSAGWELMQFVPWNEVDSIFALDLLAPQVLIGKGGIAAVWR
jgi:hypothetical protein